MNLQPTVYKSTTKDTLTTVSLPIKLHQQTPRGGIEPPSTVLETVVLPLHHQDKRDNLYSYPTPSDQEGGDEQLQSNFHPY